jgi:molybdopterin converting factor small subunit
VRIRVKIYPDTSEIHILEASESKASLLLEYLKSILALKGHYVLVKNNKILSENEEIKDGDEIIVIPIVNGG